MELVRKVVETLMLASKEVFQSEERATVLVLHLLVHRGEDNHVHDGRVLQEVGLMQHHIRIHYQIMICVLAQHRILACWVQRATRPATGRLFQVKHSSKRPFASDS